LPEGLPIRAFLRLLARAALLLLAVAATIVLVRAFDSRRKPDLKPWHEAHLESEFTAEGFEGGTFADYLGTEEQVFRELDAKVYSALSPEDETAFNRFHRGSEAHPDTRPTNWNRTFEMVPERPGDPAGGILLIHGLTDSPYSVRRIAEIFRDRGFYVLAARMPGHGTAPSGLKHAVWQDWLAVVRLGVTHVREKIGAEAALYLGGYSNGGTLAVKYTLDSLEDDSLETPGRIFLFSPAIGVTRFAAFATWHKALSFIPYFRKFRWESIHLEYDPYKYNSFPKNAGHQTHVLTVAIWEQIQDLTNRKMLARLPPMIAFQSVVDATVLTQSLIDRLFDSIRAEGSELVLFDINRRNDLRSFVKHDVDTLLESLETRERVPFRVTLVTNSREGSREMAAEHRAPEEPGFGDVETLDLSWPPNVYSLSHVAIPFPPDDPFYGAVGDPQGVGLRLGKLQPRGERNTLSVPVDMFMRLRYNPFFDYVKERIVQFCEACEDRPASSRPFNQ
jgi:alpha-beta hydrolase superfamily lysophospholipase